MYVDTLEQVEFIGRRSATYKDALSLYPQAWAQDIEVMRQHLEFCQGEKILEFGAGNGYFSRAIARLIGPSGLLVVTDPSVEQLDALQDDDGTVSNVEIVAQSADQLDLPIRGFDAIWSRGAIHHVRDKTSAFRRFALHARSGGRLVIYDIFAGTRLAQYFDAFVARSCCTGHEVAFLSREFAESLCELTGWTSPRFREVIVPWEFDDRKQIGEFLRLLFAATDDYSEKDCLVAAEEYLGVSPTRTGCALMWPMTIMTARRLPTNG